MKRFSVAAACMLVVAAAATAQARVDVNLNIDVPVAPAPAPPPPVATVYREAPVPTAPPQLVIEETPGFIYAPELGFYVSVDIPYDIVYINHRYYLYSGGYWYLSHSYWGPWAFVPQRKLPIGLQRYRYEQIRLVRDREYRAYVHDRGHYRGTWYRPAERTGGERRGEHREERRIERREDHRDDHRDEMRDRR